jgi:hypothetical protein
MFGSDLWSPHVPARTAVSEALDCGQLVRVLPGEGAAAAAFEALAVHFATSLLTTLATALPTNRAIGGDTE